jgi:hypothetical protein
MVNVVARRPSTFPILGAAVFVACLMLLVGSPGKAQASQSNYCYGVTLGGSAKCVGAQRTLNAVYGQGNQHSVCVWASTDANGNTFVNSIRCSGGPGQGIYNPIGVTAPFWPVIKNNGGSANTVYGVAYAP